MRPLDLVVLVLATYYAAVTLAKLHGPFGLAERIRHAVYRRRGFVFDSWAAVGGVSRPGPDWLRPTGETGIYDSLDDDWLAAGVSCPLCMSLYVGAALTLAWFAGGALGQAIVIVLAVAGGASAAFSVGRYW